MSIMRCSYCEDHFDTDVIDGIYLEDTNEWYCDIDCVEAAWEAANYSDFDKWDFKHPPRRSKTAKAKMGMSGRSLKNLIGPLVDRRKK